MTSLLSNQILLSLKSYYQILLEEFIKIKSKHGPDEKKAKNFVVTNNHMNALMTRKNPVKHHYQGKKIFTVAKHDADY